MTTALALVNRDADCRPLAWTPEQRLLAAVLVEAFDCLRHRHSRHEPSSQRARTAHAWIMSDAPEFGSFVYICCALGLDPSAVREQVTRGRLRRVTGRGR